MRRGAGFFAGAIQASGNIQSVSIGQSIIGGVEEIEETKIRTLMVQYGIESYFVEEGKGGEIESGRNSREMRVEISLRKDGKGIITGLFIGEAQVR